MSVSPLRLIAAPAEAGPTALFCGHCGKQPEGDAHERVCSSCGLGLLLHAPADTAPTQSDPFLIIDSALSVCGISRHAESLLGITEVDAVNRHIGEYLVTADVEAPAGSSLAAVLAWAARGDGDRRTVTVRPANTFGVRWEAVIAPCGPPNGALLVLPGAK